jgi:hypothetical protein
LALEKNLPVKLLLQYLEIEYVLQAFISHTHFLRLLMQGVDAEYVSLESVVPSYDEVDGALGQDFYDRVSDAFAERIRQCEPRVPVVTGSPP